MNPRKPTEAEKQELVEFLMTHDYANGEEEREQVRGYIEDAAIAVFDNYTTGAVGYAGKLMVVVYNGAPEQTETYIWQRDNWIDEKEVPKLDRVVAIRQ
jgi:hypothetical protein